MAAVTQTIPNYLGGVSRRADKEKIPGTVGDLTNTYPDVTFGLTKRPGFNFVREIGNADDYDDCYWFIFRFDDESYLCVVRNKRIEVFDAVTGATMDVEHPGDTDTEDAEISYLDGDRNDFQALQRQDYLALLNKTVEVKFTDDTVSGTLKGTVNTIAELPTEGLGTDDLWKIKGIAGSEDDFILKWDGQTWTESIEPGMKYKLDANTLPMSLTRVVDGDGNISFTLATIAWVDRKVGVKDDDATKLIDPSFVGHKVTQIFFHKNRLGFLSGDSVFLGQPLDFFNLFPLSYMTATEADPIDVVCSSLQPIVLFAVEPMTQGLLLFSDREQFILTAGQNGVITPATASVQSLSTFEMDEVIDPVRLGTNIIFTSQAPGYTRVFSMSTQGDGDNPQFSDIGKIVSEWIPDGMDRMLVNTQNSFIALYGPDLRSVYFYREYVEGGQILNKSWFKWDTPGMPQALFARNDQVFLLSKAGDKLSILVAFISPTSATATVETEDGLIIVNPCVDYLANPTSVTTTNNTTTVVLPFTDIDISGWTPILIQVDGFDGSETGSFWELTENNGTYTVGQDLSSIDKENLRVGYTYPYEVELPKTYMLQGNGYDYTASLTISRMKFAMGRTGSVGFEVRPRGSNTFAEVGEVGQSNWYRLDTAPIDDERFFTLPIHQKNDNFDVRITSDSPYPVSLLSMTWEGQYSPRYYSRS